MLCSEGGRGRILNDGGPETNLGRGNNWFTETVDSSGVVGKWTAIALDEEDIPHISYSNASQEDLKYARRNGTEWIVETVDPDGHVGKHTSLALDSGGRPHISYYSGSERDLKYARFDGANWTMEIVDPGENVGKFTSIALDSEDRPHVVYSNTGRQRLRYARLEEGGWNISEPNVPGKVEWEKSLVLDEEDDPHVTYFDSSDEDLIYTRFDGTGWISERVSTVGESGRWSSLELDSIGRPHVAYHDWTDDRYRLEYARYDGEEWVLETVDDAGEVGRFASLALDDGDDPHIAYLDLAEEDLRYAHCHEGVWHLEMIDAGGDRYASIAVDSQGDPHISYYSRGKGELRYARVDNSKDVLPHVLRWDESPSRGTTGDEYGFRMMTSTEVDVDEVSVLWKHGPRNGNVYLTNGSGAHLWEGEITLGHNTSALEYTVCINDTLGGCHLADTKPVPVVDNDPPEIVVKEQSNTPKTGEKFDITCEITDNIGVDRAEMEYSFDGGASLDLSMDDDGSGIWTCGLAVPADSLSLRYSFHARDGAGNLVDQSEGDGVYISDVIDIISPMADAGPDVVVDKGGHVVLDGSRSWDNIAVINYSWSFILNGREEVLYGRLALFDLPPGTLCPVLLNVTDARGNWDTDDMIVLDRDTEPPAARAGGDMTVRAGNVVMLNGSNSTDNVGVKEYTWTFRYDERDVALDGMIAEFLFEEPGIYRVKLTVKDGAGNTHGDEMTLNVLRRIPSGAEENGTEGNGSSQEENHGDRGESGETAMIVVSVGAVVICLAISIYILSRGRGRLSEKRRDDNSKRSETNGTRKGKG